MVICGGSKSYLIRQNVIILVKKYGYFGCLLRTKVTTIICGGSKSNGNLIWLGKM